MNHAYVAANPEMVSSKWWLDEYMREEIYARVRGLRAEGYSNLEVARRVGISDRGVQRIVNRLRQRGFDL